MGQEWLTLNCTQTKTLVFVYVCRINKHRARIAVVEEDKMNVSCKLENAGQSRG